MSAPSVSAVIPTCGRPEVVRRAVRSALAQTLQELEVIVVIDGPDEGTQAALAQITDTRLQVLALEQKVGGAEARNIGVRAAQAPWIAFLDDDDEWLPNKLSRQMEVASEAEVPFPVLYSRYLGRSRDGDMVMADRLPGPDEAIADYLFCRRGLSFGATGLGTSELFTSRELMLLLPFLRGLKRHQDWDWVLRAAQFPGTRIVVLPDVLAIYHMHDTVGRLSNAPEWEFSLAWARDRLPLMTPRAYSFFLATECVTRAKQVRAGVGVYASLFREFLFRGSPSLRSLILFFGFALLPTGFRAHLKSLWRSWILKEGRTAPATDAKPTLS